MSRGGPACVHKSLQVDCSVHHGLQISRDRQPIDARMSRTSSGVCLYCGQLAVQVADVCTVFVH